MKISFYVLSESKAQEFLGFICQLTQTALNKSEQSLLILASDEAQLTALDDALWSKDPLSFIPHQRLLETTDHDTKVATQPLAPVTLSSYMPADFSGIVINTTAHPVSTNNSVKPSRILEIIKPDETSMSEGRHKYKSYQQAGYELTHFKV
ncbi:DNA polymerase III subunit chi [uncultured Psychrobacter sp.]|uniref:DNA polymerase III subunit chi n=1 Tax=Psychrobacter sp. DM8 TaxID=3440636 RepID=UPI00293D53D6|nr:DNA polymerase III subunit chi [uncultured Psychrobacter sp.]